MMDPETPSPRHGTATEGEIQVTKRINVSELGAYARELAREIGATEATHLGGYRYVLLGRDWEFPFLAEADGRGIGADEDGFDAAWLIDEGGPLAEIVEALLAHDVGAYGTDPVGVAREWDAAGFDADAVRAWLAVGVADAAHARQLARAGYVAAELDGTFHGWATDEDVAAVLGGDDDED